MIRYPRLLPYVLRYALVVLTIMVIAANTAVTNVTRGLTYSDPSRLPENKVGLLLGTAKYISPGSVNPFFEYRIQAAVELYRLGKIQIIIASGDNGERSYNEPIRMKNDLIRRGVPSKDIYLDYAGFSTLDSIIRVNRIFGQTHFTVISQKFQNERAVFIAEHYHLDAVGFNARDVPARWSLRIRIREYFARTKAFLDLYLLDTQPKYLGTPIHVG